MSADAAGEQVIAIDPASRRCGWAVLQRQEPGQDWAVVRAGLLEGRSGDPPWCRIRDLAQTLHATIMEQARVGCDVVLELPRGGPGTGSRAGASSSLIVYGMAAGYIWRSLAIAATHASATLHLVAEDDWTRGWTKSARVMAASAAMGSAYRAAEDPSADMADAICLGLWWSRRRCGAGG